MNGSLAGRLQRAAAISATLRRKRRLRCRRLLEASQAMLVWYLRRGSGDRPRRLKEAR